MAVLHIDRQRFLSRLEDSGLLDSGQLAELMPRLPATDRGRVLARFLVQDGVLTRFQAENLLAGRTHGFVLGQYRILDEIGRGGMGRVFKAEHLTMNRVVALKVLAAQFTRTEKARRLFQREVRAAARLVHPHIVTAFDANRVGDRFFLVLEYIAGPTLAALVRDQGPLPLGQACEFIRQAALGLQHAHALGMVHRDIKPSNLLVQPPVDPAQSSGGLIKVTDFGLARLAEDDPVLDADESSGSILAVPSVMVMGTPDYLSPEQGRNLDGVDIRSDIYSLGCTLYFILTGEVPFPGGSPLEKIDRHATAFPEPVESLRPIVPPGVADILVRMMAKEPAARLQTPAEVAEALEPFAEDRPVIWLPPRESSMPTASSVDLMADGSPDTSRSLLGTTQAISNQSTALSLEEIRKLRRPDRRKSVRLLLYIAAAVIGFVLGAILIANGMVTKPWPP
jgi:serine/threonine-protein kinase